MPRAARRFAGDCRAKHRSDVPASQTSPRPRRACASRSLDAQRATAREPEHLERPGDATVSRRPRGSQVCAPAARSPPGGWLPRSSRPAAASSRAVTLTAPPKQSPSGRWPTRCARCVRAERQPGAHSVDHPDPGGRCRGVRLRRRASPRPPGISSDGIRRRERPRRPPRTDPRLRLPPHRLPIGERRLQVAEQEHDAHAAGERLISSGWLCRGRGGLREPCSIHRW